MKPFLLIQLLTFSISLTAQVNIVVDVSSDKGPMEPLWAWFGYDEPNYTYMKDGQKLLSEIAALSPVPVYVRTHNLLTTGDGTPDLKWGSTNAYTEDANGKPVYNWTIIDRIFDTYVERGMRPLVEIGFMPEALSTKPQPYKHTWSENGPIFTGWAHPPTDYTKWAELVFQWVRHSMNRYGEAEVKTWYWELWNEPNIGYWQGTFDEYCKLYDYTADAVKRACAECIIGGPHTTNPNSASAAKFLRDFLAHCESGKNYATGKTGSPIDYIAFHAKGNPEIVDGNIRMNMSPQLAAAAKGFEIVASFEKYKNLPIVIGESDPEGCAACSYERDPKYGYRNGTVYPSYTAASVPRIYELADQYQVNLKGILSWAFEFENQKWYQGYRDLATNGVDKPILNVFRMLGMMSGKRLVVSNPGALSVEQIIAGGVRGAHDDVHAFASADQHNAAVLIWNYHDMDVPAVGKTVNLVLKNIPSGKVMIHHYRVDQHHSNSYEAWKVMGSPQDVTPEQFRQLERAGQLELLTSPVWQEVANGEVSLEFDLPRQGVSLVRLEWN